MSPACFLKFEHDKVAQTFSKIDCNNVLWLSSRIDCDNVARPFTRFAGNDVTQTFCKLMWQCHSIIKFDCNDVAQTMSYKQSWWWLHKSRCNNAHKLSMPLHQLLQKIKSSFNKKLDNQPLNLLPDLESKVAMGSQQHTRMVVCLFFKCWGVEKTHNQPHCHICNNVCILSWLMKLALNNKKNVFVC